MKNFIFANKTVKLLTVIFITLIFLAYVYVTLTAKINQIKYELPQKSALVEIIDKRNKENVAVTINNNVTEQPYQVNKTDRLARKCALEKIISDKNEKNSRGAINKNVTKTVVINNNNVTNVNVSIKKNVSDQPFQVNKMDHLHQKNASENIIIEKRGENSTGAINKSVTNTTVAINNTVTNIAVTINRNVTEKPQEVKKTGVECFYNDSGNILLELNDTEPLLGNAIFFHESSCPEDISDIKLSFRQACSVESALRAHPENEVFLLISSPVKVQASESKNIFIKELSTYHNFNVRHINFERYSSNTPTKKIYDSGVLDKSKWPTHHASDILRYTTLYKFGGTYLDLDVIVLKSLSNLTDYTGAESKSAVAAGVINFSSSPVGKEMAVACAEEQARTFDGQQWSASSVGILKNVLTKRCGTDKISEMNESRCKGFHVYPESYFYPIYYKDYKMVFESGKTELVEELIRTSYALHVWNKFSSELDLNGSDIPFMNLAKIYCPKAFQASKELL